MLFVSLYPVIIAVEQGKWKSAKTDVHIAVFNVQPQEIKSSLIAATLLSVILSPDRYIITRRGRTISFAGSPNKKASRIAPSIPKSAPNGSRNSAA